MFNHCSFILQDYFSTDGIEAVDWMIVPIVVCNVHFSLFVVQLLPYV